MSVQGETTFPKLTGHWTQGGETLILQGSAAKGLGRKVACWIRLVLAKDGTLRGVRRFLDGTPCFADFEILAKKS